MAPTRMILQNSEWLLTLFLCDLVKRKSVMFFSRVSLYVVGHLSLHESFRSYPSVWTPESLLCFALNTCAFPNLFTYLTTHSCCMSRNCLPGKINIASARVVLD